MIAPDRGRVEVPLGDEKPALELWYPNAALIAICERGGFDVPLSESMRLVDEHLTQKTLPIYVWAGRLWQHREVSYEEIRERVNWSPRPVLEILKDVRRALVLGLVGKDPEKDVTSDPPKPAVNGAGGTHSVSPSASSGSA